MRKEPKIPINKPFLGAEEMREVRKVIQGGKLTSPTFEGGQRVREFESMLGRFVGCRYALAVNSGTAAIHAALLAMGIGRGDEILLPSFTFVATANAVAAAGAKPVFVDIKRTDYTMDPDDLGAKITARSKAVIPVHLYGHPADMDRIAKIAARHSLRIVEDAAQSLGSTYGGRQTGSLGEIGCASFYASKVLTCGEGGALLTRSRKLAGRIRMIRNQGMVEGDDTRVLGLNMRMPEINAAIAKIQMRRLRRTLQSRRRNALLLTELLLGWDDIDDDGDLDLQLPVEPRGSRYNWYLYTIAVRRARGGNERDRLVKKLWSLGIGAAVYYGTPVHRMPFYAGTPLSLPNTEWAAAHLLSLPVHQLLGAKDIRYIAKSLRKAIRAK